MKCPKCGYNSFEYHNACKKCSNDLSGYKQTFGITPIVLPPEIKAQKAEEYRIASTANQRSAESTETHDDMFAFDLPETSAAHSFAVQNDDPFNFDDDIPVAGQQQAKVEEGGFADLLESTSLNDGDPFASTPIPSAQPQSASVSSGPGEFDLENFSWDDTSAATATSGASAAADDFDSLFGDAGDSGKK